MGDSSATSFDAALELGHSPGMWQVCNTQPSKSSAFNFHILQRTQDVAPSVTTFIVQMVLTHGSCLTILSKTGWTPTSLT